MLSLALSLACTEAPCAAGYGRTDAGHCVPLDDGSGTDTSAPLETAPIDTGPTEDTFDPGEQITGDCEAPDELPDDPITLSWTWSSQDHGTFVEWVEAALSAGGERAFFVGHGGLYAFDVGDDGLSNPIGRSSSYGYNGRYHEVLVLDEDLLVASSRDGGWHSYDIASGGLSQVSGRQLEGAGAMAAGDGVLYVTTFEGDLYTYEVTASDVTELGRVSEVLASPWEAVVVGDRLYVADNSLGVAVFDVSTPSEPSLVGSVAVDGSAQDLVAGDGVLYVAAGSAGLQVFSLADPDAPSSIGLLDYGTALTNLAIVADVLYAVSHEDLVLYDVSEPEAPVPLGSEQTEQYALAVVADEDKALVADWGNIPRYAVEPGVRSPEADPSRNALYFYDGSRSATVEVVNRGADTLQLLGASTDDARFTIKATSTSVPAGESTTVTVVFEDDGEPVDSSLCLATNDPDQPLMELPLSESESVDASVGVGEQAPDFTASDLDGTSHRLSEQLGHPVLLVYFATW